MTRPFSIPLLLLLVALPLLILQWMPASTSAKNSQMPSASQSDRITIDSIRHYNDPIYNFSMAVPTGWQSIQADDVDDGGRLEFGYSIGFTSPLYSEYDPYGEYIMVELLPGTESGAFETDGSSRRVTTIDGVPAVRDRLFISADPTVSGAVELVVYQAQVVEPGFTIGIYAVGEITEADWIKDAFEIVLRTLTLPKVPFQVS